MSVTFHLYKVRPDKEECQIIYILENEEISTSEDINEVHEARTDRFSDGQIQYHSILDVRKKEEHQLLRFLQTH